MAMSWNGLISCYICHTTSSYEGTTTSCVLNWFYRIPQNLPSGPVVMLSGKATTLFINHKTGNFGLLNFCVYYMSNYYVQSGVTKFIMSYTGNRKFILKNFKLKVTIRRFMLYK